MAKDTTREKLDKMANQAELVARLLRRLTDGHELLEDLDELAEAFPQYSDTVDKVRETFEEVHKAMRNHHGNAYQALMQLAGNFDERQAKKEPKDAAKGTGKSGKKDAKS